MDVCWRAKQVRQVFKNVLQIFRLISFYLFRIKVTNVGVEISMEPKVIRQTATCLVHIQRIAQCAEVLVRIPFTQLILVYCHRAN